MAVQEYESLQVPELPRISLLREFGENQETIYHFFLDGQETYLTMTSDSNEEAGTTTYQLRYFGWEYGEADVHCDDKAASLEWLGISCGVQNHLEAIEAAKFIAGAQPFVIEAIRTDFPGLPIEDSEGNPIA